MNTQVQPGLRVSEYLLEAKIGQGAFGEVWRARHHIWEKERVAIKIPTEPAYVRNLQREGVVVHGLRHPNIVRVLGLDPYAEIPYLVMELVDGPSLRDALKEHPRGLPLELVTRVMQGTLGAVQTAHNAGILHRDLKPGNILLNLAGQPLSALTAEMVKVTDFGLGSHAPDVLQSIAQSASLDRDDNLLVGTLAYIAPELRDRRGDADTRSDLFALGVIFFELLTGERPAGAEFPSSVRADVPARFDEIFRRLYARHDRRYESAAAVLADLIPATHAAPPVPSRPAPPPPPLPTARRGRPCPRCGQVSDAEDQFCTACGLQLVQQIRRCRCGAYPGPHDQYCIHCGQPLPPTEAKA